MKWLDKLIIQIFAAFSRCKCISQENLGIFQKGKTMAGNYEYLKWLADAPLFIDEAQINALHDATLRPESEQEYVEIVATDKFLKKLDLKIGADGELGLPGFLTTFIPGLSAKAKVKTEACGVAETTKGSEHRIRLQAIHNPQRKLQELVLHYASNQTERLHFVSPSELSKTDWRDPKEITKAPRMLVFLDLPSLEEAKGGSDASASIIIPTAAEFSDGTIKQIYADLQKLLLIDLNYPSGKGQDIDTLRSERKDYWKKFTDAFNDSKAMAAVEDAAKELGRLRWIDYRLRLSTGGDTLHLHCCPAEKYDTGVFAYNLIKRGHKHGLRIIGTLKSEPDLNVLAIYEK